MSSLIKSISWMEKETKGFSSGVLEIASCIFNQVKQMLWIGMEIGLFSQKKMINTNLFWIEMSPVDTLLEDIPGVLDLMLVSVTFHLEVPCL